LHDNQEQLRNLFSEEDQLFLNALQRAYRIL